MRFITVASFSLIVFLELTSLASAKFELIRNSKAIADIVIDTRGTTGKSPDVLADAGQWLQDSLFRATGAKLRMVSKVSDKPAVVIAHAKAWPRIAGGAKLKSEAYGAYCIVTQRNRVYVLGNSSDAARYGVADLVRRWGFRWYAPSSRWHHVPQLKDVTIDLNITESPALIDRRIWYAYGMRGKDLQPLLENYQRWAIANRLSTGRLIQTGHSYGHIIRRNLKAFHAHPEYYALLPNGKRDTERAINARKLCYSNPGLIKLVTQDRLRLLMEQRRINPAAFMVSVDPSDGEGTCHCEQCKKLGTTSDRVFHLANQVARGLRAEDSRAWVGLYAYSSHRLPPTIDVESNVYVQVAMGFNRTRYTLPELVQLWSRKVGAIGLREYYGVEAWDWGLPGRMRGGNVAYHRKWIPYYARRKTNAINAETNANWGAQTLGLYVASQLMWNPKVDVDSLADDFYQRCFGDAAKPMRTFYSRFDQAPPLRPTTMLPLFRDLDRAWHATRDEKVRQRLVDMMAYLIYVARFREFDLVRSRRPNRDDQYYQALLPLMRYAWRIRHRDMVHYYALARRLCNGLPVRDKRLDFYMFHKTKPPIWQEGRPFTDKEIIGLFAQTTNRLEMEDDPTVSFSRNLEPVRVKGDDAGPSRMASTAGEGIGRFRRGLRGYLVPSGKQKVRFELAPISRRVMFTVYLRASQVLLQKEYRATGKERKPGTGHQAIELELPRANEYRVEITGDFELRVPPQTPFVYEASVARPAWVSYSGPHYFYVPVGTKELIVDANPRLSLYVPGLKKRLDITPLQRQKGKDFVRIKVPARAAGTVWHTSAQTRGKIAFLNVPPLLSFHRKVIFVPREVAEADGLTTRE